MLLPTQRIKGNKCLLKLPDTITVFKNKFKNYEYKYETLIQSIFSSSELKYARKHHSIVDGVDVNNLCLKVIG